MFAISRSIRFGQGIAWFGFGQLIRPVSWGMSPFARKVPTSSGATALQIADKPDGKCRIVELLWLAHRPEDLWTSWAVLIMFASFQSRAETGFAHHLQHLCFERSSPPENRCHRYIGGSEVTDQRVHHFGRLSRCFKFACEI